jgi:hypothetical protein
LEQHPVGPLLARAHQVVQLVAQPGEGHRDPLEDQPEQREHPVAVLEQRKEQPGEQLEQLVPEEGLRAERLVLRVHNSLSNNKWGFSSSRSARFRRSLPCCWRLSK